jgi:hypothetical protein
MGSPTAPPGKEEEERKKANSCCTRLVRVGEYRACTPLALIVSHIQICNATIFAGQFCQPHTTIQICITSPGLVVPTDDTIFFIYPRSTNKDAEEKRELDVVRSTVPLTVPSKEEWDHQKNISQRRAGSGDSVV